MSKPPIFPDTTAAGIAVDPRTLERIIPESRRPDGSVRKQIKIRPGFTPQEDMKGFRTKRQASIESNALPKGHIIGWVPPSSASSSAKATSSSSLTKSAKKNLKRKQKREEAKANWEDDDEDEDEAGNNKTTQESGSRKSTVASESAEGDPNGLSKDLERLEIKRSACTEGSY